MTKQEPRPANVTDVALWKLVRTVRARHQHDKATGDCRFCGQAWPCEAEQRAALADAAARRPITAPAPAPAPVVVPVVVAEPVTVRPAPRWRRIAQHRKAG